MRHTKLLWLRDNVVNLLKDLLEAFKTKSQKKGTDLSLKGLIFTIALKRIRKKGRETILLCFYHQEGHMFC